MILCLIPLVVLLLAFFVLPFGLMLFESFYLHHCRQPPAAGATIANYAKLFGDLFYLKVLGQTLALGLPSRC